MAEGCHTTKWPLPGKRLGLTMRISNNKFDPTRYLDIPGLPAVAVAVPFLSPRSPFIFAEKLAHLAELVLVRDTTVSVLDLQKAAAGVFVCR